MDIAPFSLYRFSEVLLVTVMVNLSVDPIAAGERRRCSDVYLIEINIKNKYKIKLSKKVQVTTKSNKAQKPAKQGHEGEVTRVTRGSDETNWQLVTETERLKYWEVERENNRLGLMS